MEESPFSFPHGRTTWPEEKFSFTAKYRALPRTIEFIFHTCIGDDQQVRCRIDLPSGYNTGAAQADMYLYKTHAFFAGLTVYMEYRRMGMATFLHNKRMEMCRQLGYKVAMCTTNGSSSTHEALLQKLGWKKIGTSWRNGNSGNLCSTWVIKL